MRNKQKKMVATLWRHFDQFGHDCITVYFSGKKDSVLYPFKPGTTWSLVKKFQDRGYVVVLA